MKCDYSTNGKSVYKQCTKESVCNVQGMNYCKEHFKEVYEAFNRPPQLNGRK